MTIKSLFVITYDIMADVTNALCIDVVTYNVLSEHASSPGTHPRCDPMACRPNRRLRTVVQKLRYVAKRRTIICLQEVTINWCRALTNKLHALGYNALSANYGSHKYGNMGVMIAYPMDKYELLESETVRVASKQCWPHDAQTGVQAKAKAMPNMIAMVKLRCNVSRTTFAVCTYHMPCAYRTPVVMHLHAAAIVRHAARFAADVPFVLAGDMNSTPTDECYSLITTQTSTLQDPSLRVCCTHTPCALKSAHMTANGHEPPHTTHAFINKGGNPKEFIAVLDYIFHSDHFVHVETHRMSEEQGPYPTRHEPSDHLMVGARLSTKLPP